ncbi:MAG TPA: efflux transporter outer membrane subunit, partial [Albitalea sp.]
ALALALQAEVATTWFRALSAEDRLAVARQSLSTVESMHRLLRTQYDAGAISRLELARQEGLVATVRASVAPLEQERQQALDALAVLLGRPVQALPATGGSLQALRLPAIAPGLPSSLLVRRPDIRAAESDLAAAHADIAAARAALLPALRLTAAGGFESASLASLLRSGSGFGVLAASLVAPIFDGGRLRGQVQLAEARREELLHAYHQAILVALREVEDSLVALQRLAEQAAHQQEVVARAAEALDLAELRWRNGAVDFATVLDAQRVRLDALAAQQATTFARYAATVELHRALGGGWAAQAAAAAPGVSTPTVAALSAIAPARAQRREQR